MTIDPLKVSTQVAQFLVSVDFHSHGAVMGTPINAIGLWARAGSWSAHHLTDGFIPAAQLAEWGEEKSARHLVRNGLWKRAKGGWQMIREVPSACGCPPTRLWRIRRDDERPHIPAEIRRAVFERDGNACLECSATDDLTLDHIHPWSLGGPDTVENLRVLCRSCNSSKGARV